jgi:phytoene synthase
LTPFGDKDSMTETRGGDTYCLDRVRRHDPDRYRCAQFCKETHRKGLVALYAFNLEVGAIPETVREPLLGRVRLQWWRDGVESVFRRGPIPEHPVMRALAHAVDRFGLSQGYFDSLLDGRAFDLEEGPPDDLDDLDGYAESTSVSLNRLCGEVLGIGGGHPALRHAGLAWALTGLMRAVPFHARAKRVYLPGDLIRECGLDLRDLFELRSTEALARVVEGVAMRARFHLENLRLIQSEAPAPKEAAPIVLTAVLAQDYLAMLERAEFDPFRIGGRGPGTSALLRLYLKGWLGGA